MMYRGLVVYQPMNYERFLEYFAEGLKNSWVPIQLPHPQQDVQLQADLIVSGQIMLHFFDLNSFGPNAVLPAPIIGSIVPVFNNLVHSKGGLFRDNLEYATITLLTKYVYGIFQIPVLVLVIDGKAPPQTNEEGYRTDWWNAEAFSRHIGDKIPYSIATCGIDELEKIPTLIAVHFRLSKDTIIDNQLTDKITHPYLPNVMIDPKNLGVEYDASLRFVEDCLEGLIPSPMRFRVWIDAKPTTVYDREANRFDLEERIRMDNDVKLSYIGGDRTAILAKPQVMPLSDDLDGQISWGTVGVWRVEPAYHVYLEYEHIAYDNMMAFQNHMSINTFQNNLASGWYTNIEVTPDMPLEEAKVAVREMVRRVKRGILE